MRPYRGIDAAERLAQRRARLIDAGLEILGAAPPARELTVRTICGGAGVAMRYFYESFSDKDVFVEAVFDHVIADLATTTQAAVAAAPLDEPLQLTGMIAPDGALWQGTATRMLKIAP